MDFRVEGKTLKLAAYEPLSKILGREITSNRIVFKVSEDDSKKLVIEKKECEIKRPDEIEKLVITFHKDPAAKADSEMEVKEDEKNVYFSPPGLFTDEVKAKIIAEGKYTFRARKDKVIFGKEGNNGEEIKAYIKSLLNQ